MIAMIFIHKRMCAYTVGGFCGGGVTWLQTCFYSVEGLRIGINLYIGF